MSRYLNETKQTTLLPDKAIQLVNTSKADAAEQVALQAQGKRSSARKRGLSTLTDLEELIGALVSTEPGDGYLPVLPHSEIALYYRVGSSATHISMLKESEVLATASSDESASTAAAPETWRRFVGQQLMLLTEIMVFCVPAFFTDNAALISPLRKRKSRGSVRSDMTLHTKMFVASKAKADTAAVRSTALHYARLARVCDVDYGREDTDLFTAAAGITLPAPHDEKTVLMLKNPTLTPTSTLLSFCTDIMMQVQAAAKLGRFPSVCSLLVSTTATEMQLFNVHGSNCPIDENTPSVSIAQLHSAVQLPAAAAPCAVADFVKAAFARGDTLHPYYGLPRLARCMFKSGEQVAAPTLNSVNSRFRGLFNAFRALHFSVTEPLYQVLDGLHKPYQVRMNSNAAVLCYALIW